MIGAKDLLPRVLEAMGRGGSVASLETKLRHVAREYRVSAAGLVDAPGNTESIQLPEFAVAHLWVERCRLSDRPRRDITSYGLKHLCEQDAESYVSNGAFIAAALAWCVPFERIAQTPNCWFWMDVPRARWGLLDPVPNGVYDEDGALLPPALPRSPRSIAPALRTRIFERDGFRCRRCGATPAEARLVIDHIQPVALGGTGDEWNLQTLCEPCNQGKGDRPPHPHDLRLLP